MMFTKYIGIDYSGRKTSRSRTSALQVYATEDGQHPKRVNPPSAPVANAANWCRTEMAGWLLEQATLGDSFIAGIDHALSFPLSYFERYNLSDWNDFLRRFCRRWPTCRDRAEVRHFRDRNTYSWAKRALRLTDKWTSSAKSVFQFDIKGQVACSTHAGIPWLHKIRKEAGGRVHFWPFDGWAVPDGKSVIAEVYPSILSKRYDRENRSSDQHDAYAVTRWLAEMDRRSFLARYFDPPLSREERRIAKIEGWILGIP